MDGFSGFQSQTFRTDDGVSIHYLHKGSGKPLILLPGWSGDANVYYRNALALSEKYSIYVFEHRGHGNSETPKHGYRISRLAKDAYEFQQYLGFQKANWLGHSMGCAVLWSMIDLFGQEHIDRLILVDEAPFLYGNPRYTEQELRLCGAQRLDLWQFCNACDQSWEEGMAVFNRVFPTYEFDENEDTKRLQESFTDMPPKSHRFLSKLLMDHITQDWRDIIPRITVETMYISGDASFATTPECANWIAQSIKGCKWVRVNGKGLGTHHMMQSCPDIFNKSIVEFLE
ncbi:MAG: alpha/beta hydrolase [Clostridiales bacterium]|nr:alpha/beta hydrolase [Clostridiales bacterium]